MCICRPPLCACRVLRTLLRTSSSIVPLACAILHTNNLNKTRSEKKLLDWGGRGGEVICFPLPARLPTPLFLLCFFLKLAASSACTVNCVFKFLYRKSEPVPTLQLQGSIRIPLPPSLPPTTAVLYIYGSHRQMIKNPCNYCITYARLHTHVYLDKSETMTS